MREIDRRAIAGLGVPSLVLMDRAGSAAASVAAAMACGDAAVVVAGPGNNGGDGFVAARYLLDAGFDVSVHLLTPANRLSGDARVNYDLLQKCGCPVAKFDRRRFGRDVRRAGVVLDAMLGTGSRGGLRGDFKAVAEAMARGGAPVVAVDVPSGIDAATGAVPGPAVAADATVTFGLPKAGLLQFPARRYVGDIHVIDIGFPRFIIDELAYEPDGEKPGYLARLPEVDEVTALLPSRPRDMHKGDAGRAYVLAGSPGMSGAAILAGRACLRGGAGLVTVGLPSGQDAAFSAAAPECLSHPLPEGPGGELAAEGAAAAVAKAAGADALAVGPGLGRSPETAALLEHVLAKTRTPVVVDADGLYLLGLEGLGRLGRRGGVLTPHPGEMAGLFGVSVDDVQSDRVRWARELAGRTGLAVILKGYLSVVAAPGEELWFNPTGNPGLASGGTGDVLTGVVLALLAGGAAPVDAARAGAYVHGLAADIAAEACGERSLIAGDVLDALPAAFAVLENGPAEGDPGLDNIFTSYA
jgi:NAD(P)H-hydrate epimerase